MVEKTLKTKLNSVSGFSSKVFPLAATKGCAPPYMIYEMTRSERPDDINGVAGLTESEYDIHIICKTYSSLKTATAAVITAMRNLQFTTNSSIYYQSVVAAEGSPELYEPEIDCFRKIVNVKIIY